MKNGNLRRDDEFILLVWRSQQIDFVKSVSPRIYHAVNFVSDHLS